MPGRGPDVSAIGKGRVYTSPMKNARRVMVLLVVSMSLLAAACGNKGDLVRPEATAETGAAG